MKAIKIGLATIVIGTIAFFLLKSIDTTSEVATIPPTENPFVTRIEKEINSISELPNNEFNKEIYTTINYLIESNAKPHPPQYPYGRLGDTDLENNQRKKNLSSNLYSAYVAKFIKQTFYVFNGSSWSPSDLAFIRSEYQLLKNSPYLESESPVDNKLTNIQRVLTKYDEINSFIRNAEMSFPTDFSLNSQYPTDSIQDRLVQYNNYRNFISGHRYLKNCNRLKTSLNNVPQVLFENHVKYLDRKITEWVGFYENYNSHITYAQSLYAPIKTEIDLLYNGLYDNTPVSTYDEYNRLLGRWDVDATKAYGHFRN